ncbi:MAG TPA: hypothetical protein VF103_05890, partial [Polyangiaceae bacterium]
MATTTTTDGRATGRLATSILAASFLVLGLTASGCAAPAKSATATPPPAATFRGGTLLDYVPAAGLRWLVVGNPSKLANDPELSRSLSLVVAPERLDGFAAVTGIRLERLSAGAIAGYSLGNLYLAELEGAEAPTVRDRFSARLAEGGVAHSRGGLTRIVGTTTKGSVQALVTVDDR